MEKLAVFFLLFYICYNYKIYNYEKTRILSSAYFGPVRLCCSVLAVDRSGLSKPVRKYSRYASFV